jgi:hypothetical protein
MKNLIFVLIIILSVLSCKKTKFSPEGPTDVRVRNLSLSDTSYIQVILDTSGGKDTLGNVAAGGVSEYFRFDKAFPKAEISAMVNGQLFSTGPVDYNGMTYIGQAKITYEVRISNYSAKKLEIKNCSPDAPLK